MGNAIFRSREIAGGGLLARRWIAWALFATALAWSAPLKGATGWASVLSREPPGDFPPPPPLHATYVFGWAGLPAASAEIHFFQPSNNRFEIEGTGKTTGLARFLWRYDVNYSAVANAFTLRPIESVQTETVRSKKTVTRLLFNSSGVTRTRTDNLATGVPKERRFNFPDVFDLHSAMLFLRSQPLKNQTSQHLVVYPTTNAYFATTTVLGREKISVRAGTYEAIKINLQLKKIGKKLELEPHRKFRRATIWVSDNSDRLILRIEAQIFIGTVFAELQSVRFENPHS